MKLAPSAIFRYAVAHLKADTDPAPGLRGTIVRPAVQHKKPLTRKDIPGFIKALNSYGGYRLTVIAMRLLLLTFVRPGELNFYFLRAGRHRRRAHADLVD